MRVSKDGAARFETRATALLTMRPCSYCAGIMHCIGIATRRSLPPKSRRNRLNNECSTSTGKKPAQPASRQGPPLDFQQHLAALEAAGPGDAHRPADRQGHRAASAGALAVRRRHARGQAPRVPVHQRGRRQRPANTTCRWWSARCRPRRTSIAIGMGKPVEEIGRPGSTPSPIRSRRCASTSRAVPGGRHQGRRPEKRRQAA